MSKLDSPKMDLPKITPEELRALSRAYPELGDKFRAAADEIERLQKLLPSSFDDWAFSYDLEGAK